MIRQDGRDMRSGTSAEVRREIRQKKRMRTTVESQAVTNCDTKGEI